MKEKYVNTINYLARFALLLGIVFGAPAFFKTRVSSIAPLEYNFVYLSLFILVATGIFFIVNLKKIQEFKIVQNWYQTIGFLGMGLWCLGLFVFIKYQTETAFALNHPMIYLVTLGALYIFGFIFATLGLFGLRFFKSFAKEITLISIIVIPYYSITVLLREYWIIFSTIVVKVNVFVMGFFSDNVTHLITRGDPSLGLEGFQVIIGAPCSGVDSLLLFTGLYWFIGLLDFDLYNTKKLFFLYFVGLIGAFIMAITRIFLLIATGAYYSPEFAMNAFHNNAGWVIFVVYFLVFIYFALPWLKK